MKKLRLKPDILYKAAKDTNRYQIHLDSGVSKTTVYTVLGPQASKNTRMDLDAFSSILFDGMGIEPNDVLNMRIGELFMVVDTKHLTN